MKRRIRGVVDPFTLGFILSLFGAAAVFSLEESDSDIAQTGEEAQVAEIVMTESVE